MLLHPTTACLLRGLPTVAAPTFYCLQVLLLCLPVLYHPATACSILLLPATACRFSCALLCCTILLPPAPSCSILLLPACCRFSYCALLCCTILDRMSLLRVDKAADYICSCKNFDGGFGCSPGVGGPGCSRLDLTSEGLGLRV